MQNDVDKHSQTILNLTISPQNSDRVRSQMREAFFFVNKEMDKTDDDFAEFYSRLFFSEVNCLDVYFSNTSTKDFSHGIGMTIATDSISKSNLRILQHLNGRTISFIGFNDLNVFKVTKVNIVAKGAGQPNNRKLSARVNLTRLIKVNIPYGAYDQIMRLQNDFVVQKEISEKMEHWNYYLSVLEKAAEEFVVHGEYYDYEYDELSEKAVFKLAKKISSKDVLNSSFCILSQYNDTPGSPVGTVCDFDGEEGRLQIDVLPGARAIFRDASIKRQSMFLLNKLGEIIQIQRLRAGMSRLSNGLATNKNLDNFIFDINRAAKPTIRTLINREELLQKDLNDSQLAAINGAFNSPDIYLIQGPPGTGKTTVIAEICYQNAIRNKSTLIASQTNLAVDNALGKLVYDPKIRALRKGNERSVQPEGEKFIEKNVLETWVTEVCSLCEIQLHDIQTRLQYVGVVEEALPSVASDYSIYNSLINDRMSALNKLDCAREKREQLSRNQGIIERMLILPDDFWTTQFVEIREDCKVSLDIKTIDLYESLVSEIKSVCAEINLHNLETNLLNRVCDELSSITGSLYKAFVSVNKKSMFYIERDPYTSTLLNSKEASMKLSDIRNSSSQIISKKPSILRVLFGWTKKWLGECSTWLNLQYAMLNEMHNAEDKEIELINNLKNSYEVASKKRQFVDQARNDYDIISRSIDNINCEINEIGVQLTTLSIEISQAITIIEQFNSSLPYGVAPEGVEFVAKKDDISSYYISLWSAKSSDDVIFEQIVNKWYNDISSNDQALQEDLKYLYINNANVIGITCNQSGSTDFTEQYPTFDVVVIDEVSKATPPEIILASLKAKKIILVGDHKQLPPMIGMETYDEVVARFSSSGSNAEHIQKSLFEELYHSAPDTMKCMLDTQYRMHSQIMNLINQFYINESHKGLRCGIENENDARAHQCEGGTIKESDHALWVDVPVFPENHEERNAINHSLSNKVEVAIIKNILLRLSANYRENGNTDNKKVGIISFYSKQVALLKSELTSEDYSRHISNLELRIGSVDQFQGIECPIVLCSFVRNNSEGDIGFAKDPKRVNVALSRARELLVIIGSIELFSSNSKAGEIYTRIANLIIQEGGARNADDFT